MIDRSSESEASMNGERKGQFHAKSSTGTVYGTVFTLFFESNQLTFSLKIAHNKFAKSATVSAQ